MKNGTEKQIKWAREIKESQLEKSNYIKFWDYSENSPQRNEEIKALFLETVRFMKENDDALWWIENRGGIHVRKVLEDKIRSEWKEAPAKYYGFREYDYVHRDQSAS